jgi:hypothetical protein
MAKTEVLQGLSKPEPAPKPQLTEFQLSRQFPGGKRPYVSFYYLDSWDLMFGVNNK